jgi:hypothetical protein
MKTNHLLSLAGSVFTLRIDTVKDVPAETHPGRSWSHLVPVSDLRVQLDCQYRRIADHDMMTSVDWTIHLHTSASELFQHWLQHQHHVLQADPPANLPYKRALSISVGDKLLKMEGVFIQEMTFGDAQDSYVKLRADHVQWHHQP